MQSGGCYGATGRDVMRNCEDACDRRVASAAGQKVGTVLRAESMPPADFPLAAHVPRRDAAAGDGPGGTRTPNQAVMSGPL
jgi:hypothetical protein